MKIFASVFLFAVVLAVAGNGRNPFKVYMVPEAPETLDSMNMANPSFWKDVPPSSGFTVFRKGSKPDAGSVFKALYNQNGLFVKAECSEPETKMFDFTDYGREQDSPTAFSAPVVEVFVDSAFTRKHSAHFAANINNTRFDRLDTNAAWNYLFLSRVVPDAANSKYSIFFFIPWSETNNENPNSGYLFTMNRTSHPVIGFNIARERIKGNGELSQWTPSERTFMEPAFFGALVLSGRADAEKKMLVLFTDKILENGIEFQGAAGKSAYALLEKIYMSKIKACKKLAGMLSVSPEKTKFEKKISSLEKSGGNRHDPGKLKSLVEKSVSLYSEIETFSYKKLETEVFEEI